MMRKMVRVVGVFVVLGALCSCFTMQSQAKILKQGFTYSAIPEDIKRKITGVSYYKNPYVSYRDLRYVTVKYYNFEGKVKKGELIVNRTVAKKVSQIFYELYKTKYRIQRMKLIDEYGGDDYKSMYHNNTSAFNFRLAEGSSKYSKHAFGLAIDINPRMNPYIAGKKVLPQNSKVYTNRNRKSCKGKYRKYMIGKNDKIVKIFKKHGFYWGGDWNTIKDYQHFEYLKK